MTLDPALVALYAGPTRDMKMAIRPLHPATLAMLDDLDVAHPHDPIDSYESPLPADPDFDPGDCPNGHRCSMRIRGRSQTPFCRTCGWVGTTSTEKYRW